MKSKTSKAILNQFMRGRNLKNLNIHKGFDEEQNFKSHIDSVHEGKKSNECDICGEVLDEKTKLQKPY